MEKNGYITWIDVNLPNTDDPWDFYITSIYWATCTMVLYFYI